ncbi:threonine-phosphate decarboxylase CobD [Marinobacter sp. SS21]|uniref:threonine-phosphate decarboxylase CobD n=1 Tax=Marinobacter sp. SS21 TaxID=2979460 RepID=UPI00232E7633|nr:threonine-phosphate decarboxylase CobD [Marinobacter sp. SS21]MDC0661223.1 threonine-phosphate decarboxylase CobD [Marinobacter sp. SS21]
MVRSDPPAHGGRLNQAARRWGIPREQWLDLSTGINPNGWPVPSVPEVVWQRLPEEDDGLAAAIRGWTGAPEAAVCIPVAGSQAAIQALPELRARCRVGVPHPGYQEHRHAWQVAGHRVRRLAIEDMMAGEAWLDELDVLVWIQPNNPTGVGIEPARLLSWYRRLAARGGWLVVDEAFAEGLDSLSLAQWAGQPGLVILKSLGKFYGLAGLRAGAALTDPHLGDGLSRRLGPWALSGPARYLMAQAIADRPWQDQAVARLWRDSERLQTLLAAQGMAPAGGSLLFQYVRHPRAGVLAEALAEHGILVRVFDQPPALRFGLPATEAQWHRLSATLTKVIDRLIASW